MANNTIYTDGTYELEIFSKDRETIITISNIDWHENPTECLSINLDRDDLSALIKQLQQIKNNKLTNNK